MFEFAQEFFRKRSLKNDASTVPTGFLPLSKIKSYVAIIDVEDITYDSCKTMIMNYFRKSEIGGSVFFQDFRKIGSEDRLITSIQTTITKKDVNWYGKPSKYKLNVMQEQDPDVFICLIKEPDYPVEYLVRTSRARFKIGRKQLPGNPFDLVVNDPEGKTISQLDSFKIISSYISRIR